jgi:mannose/cellobiose epimerase-like protein (N-acyl-D-glucosamine 2-epimerase family)
MSLFDARFAYQGQLLPERPGMADLNSVFHDYEAMLFSIMSVLADRYERHPEYPYIDMKIDVLTGKDFAVTDIYGGPQSVYGWIQGRGLEAVVAHCQWLRTHPHLAQGSDLLPRLESVITHVLAALRRIRDKNNGHIFFLMHPDGKPFTIDTTGTAIPIRWSDQIYAYSDLFCAKGMYAAARYLQRQDVEAEALEYCEAVNRAILENRFAVMERAVDPESGPQPPPTGQQQQGPYMIQLGTAALIVSSSGAPDWIEKGLQLLEHVISTHVNLNNKAPFLLPADFWEVATAEGLPYEENGVILSNPGHCIECTGLGLRFTHAAKRSGACTPVQQRRIKDLEDILPQILVRNFHNGFDHEMGGLHEFIDLNTRKPQIARMPWWSLPETIRAAAFAAQVAAASELKEEILRILSAAHNAFVQHYVRKDLFLMAYRVRSAAGEPIDDLLSTADADPGYHTGASILDFLSWVESAEQSDQA